VARTVPELGKRYPGISGFRGPESQSKALLKTLRKTAFELRRAHEQPFYSMREVSSFFHVPIATVVQVYKQLESEGLLNRIRGSKTMLMGTNADRRLTVRGLVGMPVSLSKFITQQDYRLFFLRLRRELRLRGFAAAMAFYEKNEAAEPEFCERLQRYQADTVVWFVPGAEHRENAVMLAERGIRVIGIGDGALSFGQFHYYLSRDEALSKGLAEWSANDGIAKVIIARENADDSIHEVLRLEALLREMRMEYGYSDLGAQELSTYLADLSQNERGAVIFASARLAALVGCRAPGLAIKLFQRRRVMLLHGPLSIPFGPIPDASVDLVFFDWQLIAEQIVNDLSAQLHSIPRNATVFDAGWLSQAPLRMYAQQL
jgi:hypothetical protein